MLYACARLIRALCRIFLWEEYQMSKTFNLQALIIGLLIVLLQLASPLETYAQKQRRSNRPLIKREYDKFDDTTSVSIQSSILIGDNAMFGAHFNYPGTSQPKSVDAFRLLFIAPPSVWAGAGGSTFIYILLNDQKPSKKIEAKYSSTFRVANTVSSVYATTLSQSEFKDIACANKIEMRIGLSEGALKPVDVTALKALFEASGATCQ
jgi:hypothetical protein